MSDDNTADVEGGIEITRRSTLLGIGGLATVTNLFTGDSGSAKSERGRPSPLQTRNRSTFSADIAEGLPGDKFGKLSIGQYSHSLQVSGTRRTAWMTQPFSQDVEIDNNSYKEAGSNIGYGVISFPPGQVPVLQIMGHFNSPQKSTTSIRISIANRPMYSPSGEFQPLDEGDVRQTLLEIVGKGKCQVYDETYLSNHDDIVSRLPNGSSLPTNTFIIEVKTDSSCEKATISSATTVSLELEAL